MQNCQTSLDEYILLVLFVSVLKSLHFLDSCCCRCCLTGTLAAKANGEHKKNVWEIMNVRLSVFLMSFG